MTMDTTHGDIYRWDTDPGQWSKDRWATAFNPINGKQKIWQSMISVTALKDSPRAKNFRRQPLLPSGKYIIKVYVDRESNIEKDPTHELSDRELIGQVEISGQWPPGYQPPKIIAFPQ